MKDAINFVKGAVAKNDAVPILTHIHVYDGRIQASNGKLCIDTPCVDFAGYNFTTQVKDFVMAIEACASEPIISVKNDTLTVKSGKFKANFKMLPEEYPLMSIDTSSIIKPDIKILQTIKTLLPFVSTDSNRPWSCGILFDGDNAYATNSVVMITTKTTNLGLFNLSAACANELVRIGKEPVGVSVDEHHITFIYDDGSWIRANNLSTSWPDVSHFIPQSVDGVQITDEIKKDVNLVSMFAKNNKVHLGKTISTTDNETAIENYDFPDCYFGADNINLVLQVADNIELSSYPKPCAFAGERVKGVIIGVLP